MASRAPRGFRHCKKCRKTLIPNTERICINCRAEKKRPSRAKSKDQARGMCYEPGMKITYTIAEINRMARELGITYGQMVAKLKGGVAY